MAETVFNGFRAPLVNDIDDAATSLVLDVSDLPAGLATAVSDGLDGNTMRLGIDDELMNVTGTSLDGTEFTLTVERAIEGTTAAAHDAGAFAANVWTKAGLLAYVAANSEAAGVGLTQDGDYDGDSPVASAALIVGHGKCATMRLTTEDANTFDLPIGTLGSNVGPNFGMYAAQAQVADNVRLYARGVITRWESNQFRQTVSGIPWPVNADSIVVSDLEARVEIVPDTDYQYVSFELRVGNMDGTQILRVFGNVGVPPDTTSIAIDFSGAGVEQTVGSDLVWDGNVVTSTAGGVFQVMFTIQGGID